ncbi:MAG: hypothetical protein ACSHYB_17740 [Roseibacillus sp.]
MSLQAKKDPEKKVVEQVLEESTIFEIEDFYVGDMGFGCHVRTLPSMKFSRKTAKTGCDSPSIPSSVTTKSRPTPRLLFPTIVWPVTPVAMKNVDASSKLFLKEGTKLGKSKSAYPIERT